MLQLVRNNFILKCNSFVRLNKKVKISSTYICKSVVRLKSNDVTTTINKNISDMEKTVQILAGDNNNSNVTNIGLAEQLVSKCPSNIQPYLKLMRVHKPIGSWLLFWPCSWSISIAAAPACFPDPYLLTLFGMGSLIMRGAGCTINDMWDRNIDKKVARTLDRPLVNGSVNMKKAVAFLGGQLSVGLLILLQLNWYSVFLGASSLVLVATYPLAKRVTYWPQMMLGMTFNWGIMLGYSAVQGYIEWSLIVPLYTAAVCWTIIYDTIYAHQDISDDLQLGIKSTAIKFRENTKQWLTGFSTLMSGCLVTTGIMAEQTAPYYVAVALVSSHLAWQIYSLNIKNPKDCANKFISNAHVGFLLFLGIVLGNLLKENKQKSKEQVV